MESGEKKTSNDKMVRLDEVTVHDLAAIAGRFLSGSPSSEKDPKQSEKKA